MFGEKAKNAIKKSRAGGDFIFR
ncbi:hypothetical protein MBGDF03_01126 [Thermoplasmatales archaeon SCGC AB-540-F20]|nr:hypothetical protein MBGDF03_01126 [Thermoplasmatales archaeon SCGC AB-540-F20]